MRPRGHLSGVLCATAVFGEVFSRLANKTLKLNENMDPWCNGSTGGSNPLSQGSNPWGSAHRCVSMKWLREVMAHVTGSKHA